MTHFKSHQSQVSSFAIHLVGTHVVINVSTVDQQVPKFYFQILEIPQKSHSLSKYGIGTNDVQVTYLSTTIILQLS